MKRKTIEIEKLLNEANRLLEIYEDDGNKKYINQDWKSGICSLLEYVLHETGNYHGFNFNEWIKRGGFEAWKIENDKANNENNKSNIDAEKYPSHYSLVDSGKYTGKSYDRFYY